MLQEAQLELQQYFMQYGYDFMFIDVNLNCTFDPFIDPYLFECMNREIDECHKLSEACFVLVWVFFSFFMIIDQNFLKINLIKKALVGNKYGATPLPLEISKNEYENIRKGSSNSGTDIRLFIFSTKNTITGASFQ